MNESNFRNYVKNSTTEQEIKDREIAKRDRLKAARSAFSSKEAIDLYGKKGKRGGEILKKHIKGIDEEGSLIFKESAPIIRRKSPYMDSDFLNKPIESHEEQQLFANRNNVKGKQENIVQLPKKTKNNIANNNFLQTNGTQTNLFELSDDGKSATITTNADANTIKENAELELNNFDKNKAARSVFHPTNTNIYDKNGNVDPKYLDENGDLIFGKNANVATRSNKNTDKWARRQNKLAEEDKKLKEIKLLNKSPEKKEGIENLIERLKKRKNELIEDESEYLAHDEEMAAKSAFNSEDAEKLYGKKFAGENRGEILPEYIGKKSKNGSFTLKKEAPVISSEQAHEIHYQEFRRPINLQSNRKYIAEHPITDEQQAELAKRYSTRPDNTAVEEWIQERKKAMADGRMPEESIALSGNESANLESNMAYSTTGQHNRIEKLKEEGQTFLKQREEAELDRKKAEEAEKLSNIEKNESLSKAVSKGEGFTQAELDQQTTDNLQKVLSGNTVEPLGEEGITATPKTRQVYGTQGQRINGVLGVHKEEQVNKAKEFLEKNSINYDGMSNQEIIAKRNEIRKGQLKDNISKIRTNRKVALGVGVAVTAGALVLGLSNSRGQQSNAQLYGQQPLSY